MKSRFKMLVILICTIALSCKNESPQKSTEGRMVTDNEELTNTTNYKKNGNFENRDDHSYSITQTTDSIYENWNLDDPKRQEILYSRFNMSDKQIKEYEKALREWWDFDDDNPYEKLSANDRIDKEDEILENILDDSQYDKYKEWANKNDERTKL